MGARLWSRGNTSADRRALILGCGVRALSSTEMDQAVPRQWQRSSGLCQAFSHPRECSPWSPDAMDANSVGLTVQPHRHSWPYIVTATAHVTRQPFPGSAPVSVLSLPHLASPHCLRPLPSSSSSSSSIEPGALTVSLKAVSIALKSPHSTHSLLLGCVTAGFQWMRRWRCPPLPSRRGLQQARHSQVSTEHPRNFLEASLSSCLFCSWCRFVILSACTELLALFLGRLHCACVVIGLH